jgi:hypothetical protein
MPPDTYDPDERFSIWPLTGEEALKKVLGTEDDDGDEDVSGEPEDGEGES